MCSCAAQAWGRAWVRFETVRPEGAVPSAIAWMIFGERNASGTRRRTWRSARPSAEAISSNNAVLPARTASIQLRERVIACSRVSCVRDRRLHLQGDTDQRKPRAGSGWRQLHRSTAQCRPGWGDRHWQDASGNFTRHVRAYKTAEPENLSSRVPPSIKTEAEDATELRPLYGLDRCSGDIISYSAQLLCRYFPTALRRVSALRSSARVSSSDISGENVSTTPCRPTTLGSDSATP